jgi:lipid-binding SYLF domain-containing protein
MQELNWIALVEGYRNSGMHDWGEPFRKETIPSCQRIKISRQGALSMKWQSTIVVLLLCLGTFVWAQNDQTSSANQNEASTAGSSELQQATEVVEHMSATAPDKGVPKQVLEGAKCVAVIPKLVKGAFVVGGEHGTGVATCRTGSNNWSAPAPFSVSGISWGPQIGGKSSDLLMFIMNDQGMNDLITGHIKVGADVSAAAGPVGRQASAEAGWKAGILTYSGSKGAFIGASLNGAELHQDGKATRVWYGKDVPFKDILQGNTQVPNEQARAFVNAVQNAKETAQVH